jgi:hypothetical protein
MDGVADGVSPPLMGGDLKIGLCALARDHLHATALGELIEAEAAKRCSTLTGRGGGWDCSRRSRQRRAGRLWRDLGRRRDHGPHGAGL